MAIQAPRQALLGLASRHVLPVAPASLTALQVAPGGSAAKLEL